VVQRIFATDLLSGQVAVITGSSGGIGYGIAEHFAAHGADVVITGRSREKLAAAEMRLLERTGRRCVSFACDVRDVAGIAELRKRTREAYGDIGILVNNAAANFRMDAERMTERAFTTVVDVDLVGTFSVTRAFVGDMLDARAGVVLNIVVPDAERGFPGFAHCGAAKAGITSLTRTWAREWGPRGIRVNAIGPGPVPTEGVARNMLGLGEDEADTAFAGSLDGVPLARLGTVEDIAMASTFLCSPAASWITGVSLAVDGGMNVADRS
jgi:NAD(P)-dependent dehydrogenase (short-subunit alcohol dehydrogenase family)